MQTDVNDNDPFWIICHFLIFKCQPSVYFDTYDKLLMGIPGMEETVDDNQKFYF